MTNAAPKVVFLATVRDFARALPGHDIPDTAVARFGDRAVFVYDAATGFDLFAALPEAESDLDDDVDAAALLDAIEDFVDDDAMDGVFEVWASPRNDAESLLAAYAADEQEWELGFHSAGTYAEVEKAARAAGLAVAPLVVDVKRS
ncbi:MAG: hypothetical protein IPK71_00705 [Myxococcales bacterium]|nr:hypothetical protein [Myxococcales bacterium]